MSFKKKKKIGGPAKYFFFFHDKLATRKDLKNSNIN